MVRCRYLCAAAMSYVAMTAGGIVVAAEDDFVQTPGSVNLQDDAVIGRVPVANLRANRVQMRVVPVNGRQRVFEVVHDANQLNQIDLWVFGIDLKLAELKMRELIERRVRQISNRYNLPSEKRRKLALLAHADLYRVLNEVERLRRRHQRFADNAEEMTAIRREVIHLRQIHTDFLGADSFFSKSAGTLLKNDPIAAEFAELTDNEFLLYFSQIENTVHAIDAIALQQSQRDQLIDLLLAASRPFKVTRRYDDDVAKYRLSMIPEQTMLSILGEDQWRELRPILDGYRTFGPWLIERGLIEPSPAKVSLKTAPDATHSADAATPANRVE